MPNQIRCSWNSIVFGLSELHFNIALKKGWQEAIYHRFYSPFDKRGHIVLHLLVGGL